MLEIEIPLGLLTKLIHYTANVPPTMNLNLTIPHLFWPDVSQLEIYNDLLMPSLEALLSKSTSLQNPSQEIEMWLCQAFNVEKQSCNWPIAPIMLHIDGQDLIKTNKDFWIRADPVHLRIEQNHLMLADSQAFQISKEEAEQIVQDLNRDLGQQYDLCLLPLCPDRWYIQTSRALQMHTYTLGQVTCMNINNFLPTGNDSGIWIKLFNEIQMLLHNHPINRVRESHGELAINSIWFWGAGNMPQTIQSPYTHIWSNHDLTRALALASNTNYFKLPDNADDWLQAKIEGNHLIILETLLNKAKYRNTYSWRENIMNLDKKWFAPLHKALKEGKIDKLTITSLSENLSQDFVISRLNLLKFWSRTRPLSFYIGNTNKKN